MQKQTLEQAKALDANITEHRKHLESFRTNRQLTGAKGDDLWWLPGNGSNFTLQGRFLAIPKKELFDLYEARCEAAIAALEKALLELQDAPAGASGASDDTVRQHAL